VSKLKLIILGSYVDIMKSLLEHSNPLFGRVDLVIDLKQMDYHESAMFYPNLTNEDKVRIYSVFGGIPYFNRLIDDKKSVKENIIDLIASPGARLENEVSMYLSAEISKIVNANEVFEALARGFSKYSDILSQSHVSSGPTLVDVLEKLIKMEVVEKKAPINDENNKKKMGYYICDNLSLFYFRYIFKYSSQLKIMDSDVFYDKYISKDFEENYVPHKFEEICRQYLIRQNRMGNINPVFEKLGKFYYDDPKTRMNGEFDVVSLDENGYVFYEVKFRKRKISKEIIDEEIQQVKNTGLNCYKYVFFSRSGFNAKETDEVVYIELDQLYK
ncbi:MAG: ATP-binding protein, partial [Butyrivibrio sp.]|nr:ATP-binding protein [Butyrivibrio sp.]